MRGVIAHETRVCFGISKIIYGHDFDVVDSARFHKGARDLRADSAIFAISHAPRTGLQPLLKRAHARCGPATLPFRQSVQL